MTSDQNSGASAPSLAVLKEKFKTFLLQAKTFFVQLYDPLIVKAVIVPLAGIILTFGLGLIFNKYFVLRYSIPFLSLVGMFYVFLRMYSYQSQKLFIYPSPVALGISAVGFFVACVAGREWCMVGLSVGTLAGLFFRVDFEEFRQLLLRHSRAATVAFIGAASGPFYVFIQKYLWVKTAHISVMLIYVLVYLFTSQVHILTKRDLQPNSPTYQTVKQLVPQMVKMAKNSRENFVAIVSNNFSIRYTATSNAMEGIFLFIFIFSAAAIFNWEVFQRAPFFKALGIGIVCVIVGNALMVSGLYLIADHATPDNMQPSMLRRMIATSNNLDTLNLLSYFLWDLYVLSQVYRRYILPASRA